MMKSKFTVVVCALAIALAAVIGIFITLIATGVVDSTPKKLVISSGTAEKVYDGKEITSADWKLDSGTLREGHRLKVTTMGNQTDVGSCDNEFTAVVLDENGADVSEDYELVLKPGKLVVRARMLVIKSASASKIYDGTPLFSEDFTVVDGTVADGIDVSDNYEIKTRFQKLRIIARAITVSTGDGEWKYDGMAHANTAWDETVDLDGTLADGQKIIVTVTGSVTDVSDTKKSNNGCNVAIVDANGNDVTANYTVKKQLGTLTITPRYIKLKTLDYSAVYDGAKHYCTDWLYDDGTIDRIVDGQMLTAKSGKFATIENVGSVQNVIDFDVKYGTKIVTKNYNIEYVSYGTLTLTKREVWVATDSDTRVYNGAAHYKATYTVCEDSPYQFVAKQRVSVSSYTSITNVGTVINALTLTVKNSGKDVTDNYEIVYKTYGSLTVTPRKVTVRTATTQFEYDGQPHFDVNATVAAGSYGLVRGHNFEATCYPTVTVVADGEVTNNVVYLVKNGEEDVTANYEIVYGYGKISVVPRSITVQTSSDSWTYDGLAHSAQGYEVIGGSLVELQQLIATSAWTTVTTVAETAPFGKQNVNTFAIFADEKDVSDNYAIGVVYGSLYIVRREITVCTENGMWVYDGQKHEHTYWSMEDLTQGTLAEGQTIVVTVLGAVTNVWDTYEGNNVCEVTVFDGNGNDVTANYAVTTQCGTLTILPRNVKVITLDDTHVYDGNQHYNIDWKYDDTTEYKLVDGHALQPIDCTKLVDVGSAENIVEFAVSDGMADVSQNYAIEYTHYGTITVQTRTVTLTTATNEWVYDGNAHSDIGYVLTEGSLDFVFGQTIDSLDRNEITSVGSVQNVLTYVVCDVSGNDVTANYNIVYAGYGTLTVTPREVWLQTATNAWKYDGTEHFDTTAEVLAESPFGLAEGHSFLDTSHVNITNVGYIDNIVDYIVVDGDGKDVSANYTLVRSYGGLSVTLRNITLKSASDRWCYDGQPHANDAYEITSGSIADGQTLVAELSVTVTECEVKTNEFGTVKVFANGVDVTENYEITLVVGELQVYKARVVVEMYQLSKEYDGKPLAITEDDYEISETESENLANCRVEVVWLAEKFVDAGTITPDQINERAEVRVYDQDGNDITEQCVVDFVGSTLMIHKRGITITAVSESKIYDGTPLKATTFVVSSGELAEGDVLTVTSTAEITRPGVVVISIDDTNVEITRGENSARDNYEITYVDGTLTVLEA